MPPLPNILIIVMDTVRWDHLSCYGYAKKTTPFIDRLSERGILFQNAFSASCWTPPAHASLFTGMYPSSHGVFMGDSCLDVRGQTLAEILKEFGYRTFGVSGIAQLSANKRFNRGFDEYLEAWKVAKKPRDLPKWKTDIRTSFHLDERNTRYVYENVARFIKDHKKSIPFFVFANFNTAHTPYKPPPRFRRQFLNETGGSLNEEKLNRLMVKDGFLYMAQKMTVTQEEFIHLQNLYDAEIAYLDHTLGQLFKLLQRRNILDDMVIVLLADHGENFGEHGLMYHQFCLYDSLIRIPMIWHYPRVIKGSKNAQTLISIVDVLPSILRLIGLSTGNYSYLQGHPLFSDRGLDIQTLPPFIIAEYYTHPDALGHFQRMAPDFDRSTFDKGLKCIRTERHKFIIDSKGHEELYDLVNDSKEQHNILNEAPEIASQLRVTLFKNTREFARDIRATVLGEQDETTLKQLKALGYL